MTGLDSGETEKDEGAERDDLDDDQDDVERGTFTGADQQQAHDRQRHDNSRQVDQAAGIGSGQQEFRQFQTDPLFQPADQVGRPADCDGRTGQRIFENQGPTDDPGRDLAHGRIGIGIGGTRCRNQGRHFGIGQGGTGADKTANGKGQDNARSRQAGADAGQGVDTCADDAADTQRHQVRPAQRLGQRLAIGFGSLQRL